MKQEMVLPLNECGRHTPDWGSGNVPCRDDSCCNKAMLSPSSSRISTNCPERIRWTRLFGIGSAAGDRINPAEVLAGTERGKEVAAAAAIDVTGGQGELKDMAWDGRDTPTGTDTIADEGGRLPRTGPLATPTYKEGNLNPTTRMHQTWRTCHIAHQSVPLDTEYKNYICMYTD